MPLIANPYEYGRWMPEPPSETEIFDYDQEAVQYATEERDDLQEPFIDPRTGNIFGTYPDEDIIADMSGLLADSVAFEMPAADVAEVQETLKPVVESDPTIRETRDGLFQIIKDEFDVARMSTRANELHQLHMQTGDESYREEALKIQQEIMAQTEKMPQSDNLGHIQKIAKYSAGAVGYMSKQGQEVLEKAPFGPARMAAEGMLFSKQQMTGDLWSKLYNYTDEETGVNGQP